eukprot:gene5900-6496_t
MTEVITSDKGEERQSNNGGSLYVSNLSRNVRLQHLQEIFGHYGHVKEVDLPIDRRNGMHHQAATVVYHNEKEAEQAMFYLDGGQIDGKVIKVSYVLVDGPKRRSPSPLPPSSTTASSLPASRREDERTRDSRPSERSERLNRDHGERGRSRDRRDSRSRLPPPPPPAAGPSERGRNAPGRSNNERSMRGGGVGGKDMSVYGPGPTGSDRMRSRSPPRQQRLPPSSYGPSSRSRDSRDRRPVNRNARSRSPVRIVIAVADHALLHPLPVPMIGGGDPLDRGLLFGLAPALIQDPDPPDLALPDRHRRLALHPLLRVPRRPLHHLVRVHLVVEAEIVVVHEGNSIQVGELGPGGLAMTLSYGGLAFLLCLLKLKCVGCENLFNRFQ